MTAALALTEDQVFDTLWTWVASLFAVEVQPYIFKGFQNQTATPTSSYIVIQPGVKMRQDQARRDYVPTVLDPTIGVVNVSRGTMYSYQVDCYGQASANYADIVTIAWRSLWACDALTGTPITPLYADEPVQLNLVNGEGQFEQRFMSKLYLQTNTAVALPQFFFTNPPDVDVVVADDLPL